MIEHLERMKKSSLCLSIFLLFTSFSGCNGQNQEDLIRALIASCGERTVFLNAYWNNVDDQSAIEIDPLGGYIFLYWIDVDGNACHGIPGVSGQPGPFVVSSVTAEAYSAGNDEIEVSADELDEFQVIPFDLGPYNSEGMHFVQYVNTIWRVRESGKVFIDRTVLHFSVPEIVSLDQEFCLVPVYAYNQPDCGPSMVMLVPSMSFVDGPDQNPDMCKTRVMPNTVSVSSQNRLNYCLLILPHGLEVTDR